MTPVTKPFSAKARIALPISSGCPTRPTGSDFADAAKNASFISFGRESHHAVSTTPGETIDPYRGKFAGQRKDHRTKSSIYGSQTRGTRIADPSGSCGDKGDRPCPSNVWQSGLRTVPLHPELGIEAAAQVNLFERGERPRACSSGSGKNEMIDTADPLERGFQ
jgi:hypothetical protein